MIHDVDESIRALVRRDALEGSDVDLVFDAPTTSWAASRTRPTVDIYLYDIHEEIRRRAVGPIEVLDEQGRTIGHRPPPRWFRLSYFVTAWTQRPEDEHRLLSAVLGCWLRYDSLPIEVRAGALADVPDPVLVEIAMPTPDDKSVADVWSALGGELKPSLNLVLVVPMDTKRVAAAAQPVREETILAMGDAARTLERRQRHVVRATPG